MIKNDYNHFCGNSPIVSKSGGSNGKWQRISCDYLSDVIQPRLNVFSRSSRSWKEGGAIVQPLRGDWNLKPTMPNHANPNRFRLIYRRFW